MTDNVNKRFYSDNENSEPNPSKMAKTDNNGNENLSSSSLQISDDPTIQKSESLIPKCEKNKCNEIEETLICSICQEIMHNCVSIQPCLHSFCAICLLNWKKTGTGCPTCRGNILKVSKNHLVNSIVEKFLAQNPDKARPASELKEEDLEVEKNKAVLFSNEAITIERTNCRFCNYPGVTLYSGNSPMDNPCNNGFVHVRCYCCQLHIPDIPGTHLVPENKCQKCDRHSCSLLFGDCSGCGTGCLFTFKDYVLNSNLNNSTQVPQFIPDNFFEMNVLRNYLRDQNITVLNMFSQCLDKLASKEIHLANGIDHASSLCVNCSKQTVLDMVYEYYVSIPKSRFPRDVSSRRDCYYGRNCRTQCHRQSHCVKFNHACPQTRFY